MRTATVNAFSCQAQQLRQQPVRVAGGGRAAAATAVPTTVCQQQQRRPSSPAPAAAQQQQQGSVTRRSLLALPVGLAALAALPRSAAAFVIPPPGYRYHVDKLDGYSFFYPEDWQPVTTSGNDVFYRNPFNVEENLFVNVSSPSSSKYTSVADLGSAEEAAQRTQQQYLEEFMSTRLGVKRTAEVVASSQRTGADGQLYYDIQTRVRSYASRNQLAVTQDEINSGVVLEWDRIYLAVLGVAGKRLYEFRLQADMGVFEKDPSRLLTVCTSFACKEVAV